jgi:hypothetical protein
MRSIGLTKPSTNPYLIIHLSNLIHLIKLLAPDLLTDTVTSSLHLVVRQIVDVSYKTAEIQIIWYTLS